MRDYFLLFLVVRNKQSLHRIGPWANHVRGIQPPVGIVGRAPGCIVSRIANYRRTSHAFFPRPLLWSLNLAELFCATPCRCTAINARSLIFVRNRPASSARTTSTIYQICIQILESPRSCEMRKDSRTGWRWARNDLSFSFETDKSDVST